MVKNPPAMWETRVQSLGWEDPLEEGKATLPVPLPGESPWTEEPGRLQSTGRKESDMTKRLSTAHLMCWALCQRHQHGLHSQGAYRAEKADINN